MAGKAKAPSSNAQKQTERQDGRGADGRVLKGNKIGRQFQPGNKSGGRKKLPPELVEMCRALTPQAIETAKQIMLNPAAKDGDRLRAAEIIVDRGYGKPRQAVDVDMETAPRVVFLGIDEVKD